MRAKTLGNKPKDNQLSEFFRDIIRRPKAVFGFLKVYFKYHFFGEWKRTKTLGEYRVIHQRIKQLRELDIMPYELSFLEGVLEDDGYYYKMRMTGKANNKFRYKRIQRGARYTNYR